MVVLYAEYVADGVGDLVPALEVGVGVPQLLLPQPQVLELLWVPPLSLQRTEEDGGKTV